MRISFLIQRRASVRPTGLLLTALLGCGTPAGSDTQADPTETGDDTGDSGADSETANPGVLLFSDATNYQAQVALTVTIQTTHEGEDTKVDWSGLTADLQGHPVDPVTDISLLGLALLPNLTPDEAVEKLVSGMLVQEDIGTVYTTSTHGATTTRLSDMRDLSANFDATTQLIPDGGTFLLVVQPVGRPGAVSLTFIEPRADAPSTEIVYSPETATLDFSATLAAPLTVSASGPWGADWSTLTTGASGSPVGYTPVDGLWIARYDDLPAADIPGHFFDLELEADALWKLSCSGVDSVEDLTTALAADGTPFPGFTAGPTWAVALRCARCTNAAPPYLAVIEVVP